MSNTYIPQLTRRDLWIKAGARCQFRGCNKPIDRNFLTQEKVVLGEYCHIIGDSTDGPRGDSKRSKDLASDPVNLILCCVACHKTIDDSKLQSGYSEALLIEMKREHEQHIQRLYDAKDVKRSLPLIITGRIAGTPTSVNVAHARYAVLQKTGYSRFPSYIEHVISLNEVGLCEEDELYWPLAKRAMDGQFDNLLTINRDSHIEHVDIFGLAQIPVLMYAGYRLGDRIPATVHHAFRDQENKWLWPSRAQADAVFSYILPDAADVTELALMVSLSGTVRCEDVAKAVPGLPIASLEAVTKSAFVIAKEEDLAAFITAWRALLAEIYRRYGHIKLHIFPAVPNSVAIEMGRCVHPKVLPAVKVWDFISGKFSSTIEYGGAS